jgi:hypothetical protein
MVFGQNLNNPAIVAGTFLVGLAGAILTMHLILIGSFNNSVNKKRWGTVGGMAQICFKSLRTHT